MLPLEALLRILLIYLSNLKLVLNLTNLVGLQLLFAFRPFFFHLNVVLLGIVLLGQLFGSLLGESFLFGFDYYICGVLEVIEAHFLELGV